MEKEGTARRRLGFTRPRGRLALILALGSGVALALAGTLSAGAATASAPPPTAVQQKITVIHGKDPRSGQQFSCDLVSGIAKSKKYPGFIVGTAHVKSCEGDPYPEECAATADMQIDFAHHGWENDGDGPTRHGCPPAAPTSAIKKKCKDTSEVFHYRTMGIFVIIWLGTPYSYELPSPTLGVVRVC